MYTLPSSLPYVDLLPGPFLLLIFIPLLPLALFSLGARPPTGSSFDFLTDELWRTTALLGIAVTVGLCVGVYPSSMGEMTSWLKSGNMSWGSNYFAGGGGWFGVSGTPGKGIVKGAIPVGRRVMRRAKPSFDRTARNHITALRYYYSRLYNAATPKSTSVLILGILITLSTIVITGKTLQSIYESDHPPPAARSSQSTPKTSPWVSAEYEARKKDKDEKATLERYRKDEEALVEKYEKRKKDMEESKYLEYMVGKCKERKKDLEELKKMLKRKGLEPAGLDIVPGWYLDPDPVEVKEAEEVKEVKETKVEKKEVKVKDTGVMTMGDKIRTALLGKTLAGTRKKEKAAASSPAAGGAVVMAPGTSVTPAVAAVPERGPGWEVATDPTAAGGLVKSAGNAEALARGMGK